MAFLAYRIQSTLLASGGPTALNRASEATAPFAYIVGPGTREDSTRSLLGTQPALAACRNGGLVKDAFPAPVGKPGLDRLQVLAA